MATTTNSRQQNRFAPALPGERRLPVSSSLAGVKVQPAELATLGHSGQPRLTSVMCFHERTQRFYMGVKKVGTTVICTHICVTFFILNKQIEVISQLCIRSVTLFSPLLNQFSNSAQQKLHDLGAKPSLSFTYIKASLIFPLITHKHEKAR